MNIHKNARLTLKRRIELVRMIVDQGLTVSEAACTAGVSAPTARKWLGRYLAEGAAALRDRSSRPKRSPRAIGAAQALAIVELRRRRLTQARIAASVGLSASTIGRVLRRAGLSRLSDLEPSAAIVRYEHERPGDLLHIDTKKLGRIERMGHRITGNRRDVFNGAGWEFLFVAVDDHSRIGFTDLYPDERQLQLREWAYGIAYNHSKERQTMLERWIHHYNWHRPHQGIRGIAPISRLPRSRNNLLTLHN